MIAPATKTTPSRMTTVFGSMASTIAQQADVRLTMLQYYNTPAQGWTAVRAYEKRDWAAARPTCFCTFSRNETPLPALSRLGGGTPGHWKTCQLFWSWKTTNCCRGSLKRP